MVKNIKHSIEDYVENEGEEDKFWNKIDVANIEFELKYDLAAFLDEFDFFNLSVIATESILTGRCSINTKPGQNIHH